MGAPAAPESGSADPELGVRLTEPRVAVSSARASQRRRPGGGIPTVRPICSLLLAGALLAGCSSGPASTSPGGTVPGDPTAPQPIPQTRSPAGSPSSTPAPTAEPAPLATPSPAPEAVTGWPAVSLRGVSMRGRRLDDPSPDGKLVYAVTLRGLEPGSSVVLRARGRYQVDWACGVEPEPCGEVGCGPLHVQPGRGTVKVTTPATAGPDGVARARIRLVAPPPAESCPADPSAPWGVWLGHRWDRIEIADPANRLILTPEPVVEEDTI